MCGRFARTSSRDTVAREFGITRFRLDEMGPRYNIAPSQAVDAITAGDGERQLEPMRWGLAAPAGKPRPINARAETVAGVPLFREAFRQRRCLVVADGFYEWRREGERKTPHFIRLRSGRPFTFAAIWSPDAQAEATVAATCALLTCAPNELVAEVHNRMPVILAEAGRDLWLDPTAESKSLRALLLPYPAAEMEAYPVSTYVNSPRHTGAECIRPLGGSS